MRQIPTPDFTIEKIVEFPVQSKYNKYRNAVAKLQEGEAVVVRGLDRDTLWAIQSNMGMVGDVKIATRSIKEEDKTYTLYLTQKEGVKKEK